MTAESVASLVLQIPSGNSLVALSQRVDPKPTRFPLNEIIFCKFDSVWFPGIIQRLCKKTYVCVFSDSQVYYMKHFELELSVPVGESIVASPPSFVPVAHRVHLPVASSDQSAPRPLDWNPDGLFEAWSAYLNSLPSSVENSLESIWDTQIPSIIDIPLDVVFAVRSIFMDVNRVILKMNRFSDDPDIATQSDIAHALKPFLFKTLLRCSKPSERTFKLSNLIKSRILLWQSLDFRSLWRSAAPIGSAASDASTGPLSDRSLAKVVELVRDNRIADACKLLGSRGTAPANLDTVEKLSALHPPPSSFSKHDSVDNVLEGSFRLDLATFRKNLAMIKRTSSPGLSSVRSSHLRALCAVVPDDLAAKSQVQICNLYCGNLLPAFSRQFMCGGPLVGLIKDDKGALRPLAKGEIERRVVGKSIVHAYRKEWMNACGPYQWGFGVKGSIDVIGHAVSILVEKHVKTPQWGILKVDFRNAFNMMDRSCFRLNRDLSLLPTSNFVNCIYGYPTKLKVGSHSISSSNGIQQGCNLGPPLFCEGEASFQNLVQEATQNRLDANIWYIDDGTLIGNVNDLFRGWQVIDHECSSLGLSLNPSKCELWSPDYNVDWSSFPDEFIRLPVQGFKLLGVPHAHPDFPDFAASFVREKIISAASFWEKVLLIPDYQSRYRVAIACAGYCKVAHLPRTVSPVLIQADLVAYDEATRRALESIIGAMTDLAWRQAQLPVGKGGLGARSAARHATVSYAASVFSSAALISSQFGSAISVADVASLKSFASFLVYQAHGFTPQEGCTQAKLSKILDTQDFNDLFGLVPTTGDQIRLSSILVKHSGDWLKVSGSVSSGHHLSNAQFRVLLRLRLGLSVSNGGRCSGCHSALDSEGYHSLTCMKMGTTVKRHDEGRQVLFNVARLASLKPVLEKPHLLPGSKERPGDVYLELLYHRAAALDFTLGHALVSHVVPVKRLSSPISPPACLELEKSKMLKFHSSCDAQNIDFYPVAFDTFCAPSPTAVKIMNKIASFIVVNNHESPSSVIDYVWKSMSIALTRKIAEQILLKEPASCIADSNLCLPLKSAIVLPKSRKPAAAPPLPVPVASLLVSQVVSQPLPSLVLPIGQSVVLPMSPPKSPLNSNSTVPIQQSPASVRNSRPNSPSILSKLPVNPRMPKAQSLRSKSLHDDRPLSLARPKRSCTLSANPSPSPLLGFPVRPVASDYF